jgi:amino acid transporter
MNEGENSPGTNAGHWVEERREGETGTPQGAGLNIPLLRSLGRFDLLMLAVAAVISVDTIGVVASGGGSALVYMLGLLATFLLPYGMIFSELTSSFTEEGGPYMWVRLAYGRFAAALAVFFYWVTNPIWLGGTLATLAGATFAGFLWEGGSEPGASWVFQAAFIWTAILVAIISLKRGKYIITLGAIAKLALVTLFTGTAVVYAFENGIQAPAAGFFTPTLAGFLGVAPILLFALSGFEAASGAAEEMRNPAKDMPVSILRSGLIACAVYLLPVVAIFLVVPAEDITGVDGFMAGVDKVFSVYGSGAGFMTGLAAVAFILVLLTQGAAWMVATDRMQAVAGADGAFPAYFGKFSPRFGTPLRVNMASGIVATVFMTMAWIFLRDEGESSSLFTVVLLIATTTLLISYLLIVPSVLRLRRKYPQVRRPYRIPGGRVGLWMTVSVTMAWFLLGATVAVAPGLLEGMLGIPYDFEEYWGLTQLRVEAFTLGTLLTLGLLAILGYLAARKTRKALTSTT